MDNKRRIYGLLGHPVKHSFSPAMHNAAFKACKECGVLDYDAEYKLFEIKPEELEDFLLKKIFEDTSVKDVDGNSIPTKDISGLNITIPHKVKAREILEKRFPCDKDAESRSDELFYVKSSGAINTIKRVNGKLEYYNTDAGGFRNSLEQDLDFKIKDKNVLLIGCGGAGRAIIASLSWIQTGIGKMYATDNNPDSLQAAKEHFRDVSKNFEYFIENRLQFISEKEIPKTIKNCDLLVNATPIGMKKDDPPVIGKDLLRNERKLSVYDIVYSRSHKTKLIEYAQFLDLPNANGLRMLLHQGMLSFKIWTGKNAPREVMWKALNSQIS